jgi:cell division protein FtsI (penicillin-binding protein 3)
VRITGLLLLLPFLVLAARAAHLSLIDRRGAERGTLQTHHVITLMPERGIIVDRTGIELALSIDAPSVYTVPAELPDLEDGARRLVGVLGGEPGSLVRRMRGHPSFLFVERWVDGQQAARVRELELPGVGILEEPRRVYPHKELAAPVVGFANIDGTGVRGIEQQEDAWLRGAVRRIPVERDARGRLLAAGDLRRFRTSGGDIALTLDTMLQADAAAALRRAVEASGARGGVAISLDVRSGDILALVESPSFDPNRFREVDYPRTRSRAFLDAAEPGSVLKAFLVAAALEHGAIDEDQRFDCENGQYRVPGKLVRDLKPHGELGAADILRVSSNIGAVKVAHALGPELYFGTLRGFGFGRVTGSGFPEESAGLLRDWRSWRPLDHATIAFGQGISVTAVQLAAATAALANDGEWRAPRLIAARRGAGGAWLPAPPGPAHRVVRRETARRVVAMLEGVVAEGGTGRQAALRDVRVAGKTGTAQKFDVEAGRYAEDRFSAWFVGIVPADAPLLAIAVGLDEPRRPAHTGGAAAAPLFAEVAAAQLARFGILTAPLADPAPAPTRLAERPAGAGNAAPTRRPKEPPARVARRPEAAPDVASAPRALPAPEIRRAIPELARLHDRVLLPDFRGLTVSEVRRITESSRIAVQLSGRGRAVSQQPPPGTVVAVRDARVRVRFEERPARREGES